MNNKILKIALLQIAPTPTIEGNLIKGIEACKKAKQLDADIVVFPEMWSIGYNIYNKRPNEWMKEAISIDSDFVQTFQQLSKELNMAIAITFLEKYNPKPKNTVVLFDRFGNLKHSYSKVHTCDFSVEINLTPGEEFYVTSLDTKCGEVMIGSMICYDREFPESARILMLKGAELIIVPNACPMEINRLSQLRARAYENMTAIATCNYPKDVPDCNGHSSIFDGVAYLPTLNGSRDTCIFEADESEGIFVSNLDLNMLRNYREKEVHGNAYRRPEKYTLLLDKKINSPFIRNKKLD